MYQKLKTFPPAVAYGYRVIICRSIGEGGNRVFEGVFGRHRNIVISENREAPGEGWRLMPRNTERNIA